MGREQVCKVTLRTRRTQNTEYRIKNTESENTEYKIQNTETHVHKITSVYIFIWRFDLMIFMWANLLEGVGPFNGCYPH